MELNSFAKDAESAYRSMVASVNEAKDLTRSMRIANDDKTEMIEELKKENAIYSEDIKILLNRLQDLESKKLGECKKEPPTQSSG